MTVFIYIWKQDKHIAGAGLFPSSDEDRIINIEYEVANREQFENVLDGLVYENGRLVVKQELKYQDQEV